MPILNQPSSGGSSAVSTNVAWIDTAGNDTTGNGTPGKPVQTLTRAEALGFTSFRLGKGDFGTWTPANGTYYLNGHGSTFDLIVNVAVTIIGNGIDLVTATTVNGTGTLLAESLTIGTPTMDGTPGSGGGIGAQGAAGTSGATGTAGGDGGAGEAGGDGGAAGILEVRFCRITGNLTMNGGAGGNGGNGGVGGAGGDSQQGTDDGGAGGNGGNGGAAGAGGNSGGFTSLHSDILGSVSINGGAAGSAGTGGAGGPGGSSSGGAPGASGSAGSAGSGASNGGATAPVATFSILASVPSSGATPFYRAVVENSVFIPTQS